MSADRIIVLVVFIAFHISHFTFHNLYSQELDIKLKNVYPKIVTPAYGLQDNNRVFFEFKVPQGGYEFAGKLKVFDIKGHKVTEPATSPLRWISQTEFRLPWDIRDTNGFFIPPGVYIYQFESPKGKIYAGTIIVAR